MSPRSHRGTGPSGRRVAPGDLSAMSRLGPLSLLSSLPENEGLLSTGGLVNGRGGSLPLTPLWAPPVRPWGAGALKHQATLSLSRGSTTQRNDILRQH